jgi:hypothetical protein
MREGLVYWAKKDPASFPLQALLEELSREDGTGDAERP